MPRKKYRGGGDIPHMGGNFRGRGNGRGRGGGGSRYFTHDYDFSEITQRPGFSLAEEAKNTERHHGNYASNALRHSKIAFIAAGHLEPSDLLKPLNSDKIQPQPEQTKDSTDGVGEDETMQSEEANDSPHEPSTGILPQGVDIEKLTLDPPETQPFVVDIVGDPSLKPRKTKVHVPVRSPSPGSSCSSGSEKIVFVPRKMRSGLPRANSPGKSRVKSQTNSPQLPPPRAQPPMAQTEIVEKKITKATSVVTIDDPVSSFIKTTTQVIAKDTSILPNPFPSGPPAGYATPTKKRCRKRRQKKPTSDDKAVIEDYIENVAATMRAEATEATGESSAAADDMDTSELIAGKANRRDLGGEDDWSSTNSADAAEDSDAVNKYKAEMWEEHNSADFDISTDSEGPQGLVDKVLGKRVRPSGVQYLIKWEGYETDDAAWVLAERLDSSSDAKVKRYEEMLLKKASEAPASSEDENSDEGDDEDENEIDTDEDLKLARALQRQEALGITGSDLELNLDFMELDPFPGNRAGRKAAKRAIKTFLPDISPNTTTGFFPSASRLADAYDDFDPMDWDRPSVKRQLKKKRGKGKIIVLNLSDSELEENIQNSWMKDREKKRVRKQEREALRAEGLLGGGKHGKKDMKAKYTEGVTIEELQKEIAEFLLSTHQSLALPPMDKSARKTVHVFASAFNLNSKSVGSGKKRFPTLYKTSRSAIFGDEATIASVMSRRRFLNRPGVRGSGSAKTHSSSHGGAVHHREGDIVGASAPEIGVDNRGRKMLEKMGYKAGMALGLEEREGIVKPVEAVVKISKAGLG